MKKFIVTLALLLFTGGLGYQAYAIEESLDYSSENTVETSSELITPHGSASKPTLKHPGGGGSFANFNTAMSVGGKTTNHSTSSASSLKPTSTTPNSSKDLISGGQVKQRRYYDSNGNAIKDIDYFHGGVGHTFPHIHYWSRGVRNSTAYPARF